jgi:eukaryotic-like serine/threonine-protein kinase
MPGPPVNTNEFLDLVRKSGVVDDKRLDAHIRKLQESGLLPPEPSKVAGVLIRDGFLTHFQADNIMQGRWRRFTIGKYKVLEKIGSGGMGQVYLCEHKLMRRRVAVKVLPTAKADDDAALERFYREGRAVAALDHPNIVHAYDIDQDDKLHFLVMEYVDGANLQEIVKRSGPMDIGRACHYIRQAALGLEHAHQQANIVHRDIKPGNILVDRAGVVKILDMGLARFFEDEDDILTKKYDENILGTADYLAPEQALDSHSVDIRADIYSLGATFFFMLTGKTPFGEGTVAQKLIWHQTRQPKALAEFRADVPEALQEILSKMMAKEPAERYALPARVAEALAPFTQTAIGPPPENEMPHLSPAATGAGPQNGLGNTTVTKTASSGPRLRIGAPEEAPSAPLPKIPGRSPSQKPSPAAPKPSHAAAAKAPTVPPSQSRPGQPARQAATLPEEIDEQVPWEKIASDTSDLAAKEDTAPRSVPSLAPAEKVATLVKRLNANQLWAVGIAIAALLLIAVSILFWKFVLDRPAATHSVRQPLTVSADGARHFKSIKQALRAAQPGDVVELFDAAYHENLVVDHGGQGVTLKAAPGVSVRWLSASKDAQVPLIHISKAPNFRINGQGIILDGTLNSEQKVRDLLFITLSSPGLTIEDLHFANVGQNAVKIMNVQGTKEQPVRLLNLALAPTAGQKNAVGFYFDADSNTVPPINDYIETTEIKGAPVAFKTKDGKATDSGVLGNNISGLK